MRRLDNIDLRLLRVFVALVEAGGFAGAQVVLNLSQSTLSTHLSDLEKRIGGPLCVRGRKAFRLTELGRATHDAARKLFADIEEFGHRIGTASGRLTGRLRIGVVDGVFTSPALGLQETLFGLLQPDYDVFIDLMQSTPQDLEQAVADGRRDVVIGPFAQKAPGVLYREAYREPHHLYCGRGHPFFGMADAQISRADIEASRLSVRGYRQLDDLYRIGHPRAAASVLQMEAQAMLILSGRFIGFLPCHYAEPQVAAGRMRAVQRDRYGFSSQHHVAHRRGDSDRPLIAAFVDEFLRRAHSADQGRDDA
ncbi:MAG: LysR family transcriptional regulator [Ancalomicrobiaceae bacterium]|nr:LysR family transcriptional regulator [Ancalomicrobiaceae bacterium]